MLRDVSHPRHVTTSRKEKMVKALYEGKAKRRGKERRKKDGVHAGARNRPNSRAKLITLFAAEFLRCYIINYLSKRCGEIVTFITEQSKKSILPRREACDSRYAVLTIRYGLSIDAILREISSSSPFSSFSPLSCPFNLLLRIVPTNGVTSFRCNRGTHMHEGRLDIERHA